jgi:ubiquinone/menaquinone biosynthesis C-methylase UbiE
MTPYSPKDYWANIAEDFRLADSTGLAPVLHPGTPSWFNELIDKLQFQAMRRALALAQVLPGSKVLDVGCGTGRWVRRYAQLGLLATGLDGTRGMLTTARKHGTIEPLVAGEARQLPFLDSSFDCVTDVTVIQHIPSESQTRALSEMMRVLRPGGRLILVELIRGAGPHIFPHPPENWIEQVTSHNAKLIAWFGQEFLLPDRLFVHLAQSLRGGNGTSPRPDLLGASSPSNANRALRSAYWRFRRITTSVSAWIDPLTEKICTARLATHGVFVFRK